VLAVYGRENRLKVARDEAKAAAEEAEKAARHKQAEAEARRALLLRRAQGIPEGDADAPAALAAAAAAPALPTGALDGDGQQPSEHAGGADAAALDACPASSSAPLEHINFFKDLEAREAHPERAVSADTHPALLQRLSTVLLGAPGRV